MTDDWDKPLTLPDTIRVGGTKHEGEQFVVVKSYPFAVSDRMREIMSRLDYETSTDIEVVDVRVFFKAWERIVARETT